MKPDGLAKLHDIVTPAPPSWTPQTPGWYALFAIAALAFLWFAWRQYAKWRANAYRREALHELVHCSPAEIDALLKRTALAAWPRKEIASLSGPAWLTFLERTCSGKHFPLDSGNLLLAVTYKGLNPSAEESQQLQQMASAWIRGHHV